LSSPVSVKAVRWREGFKEKVSFEFRVEKVGVMDNESGDDEAEELREFESEKKNDQDSVDGMRQEVYFKGKEMYNEMSGQ